jgi:8-oxo-dGTP pyrophosphatase MutT (NUDIX family)
MSDGNPWTIRSSTKRYEGEWISVVEHEAQDASGQEGVYAVVHFRKVGVRMLPIDADGTVLLVGQYRFAAGYDSWELPAGGREKGEAPQTSAARELAEEVGLAARHWLRLPHLIPSGAICDERQELYLAWGLSPAARETDPQEVLRVKRVPFREVLDMVLAGEISDAGTVAAVLTCHVRACRGELPEEIARHLRAACAEAQP